KGAGTGRPGRGRGDGGAGAGVRGAVVRDAEAVRVAGRRRITCQAVLTDRARLPSGGTSGSAAHAESSRVTPAATSRAQHSLAAVSRFGARSPRSIMATAVTVNSAISASSR